MLPCDELEPGDSTSLDLPKSQSYFLIERDGVILDPNSFSLYDIVGAVDPDVKASFSILSALRILQVLCQIFHMNSRYLISPKRAGQ